MLHAIPTIFLTTAVICLVLRIHYADTHFSHEGMPLAIFHQSHFRIDSLMFGVLIAYWWHLKATSVARQWVERHGQLLVLAGSVFFVPAFIWVWHETYWMSVYGVMLFYIGAGLMVLGALCSQTFPGWIWRQMANLGHHSYSVYLWMDLTCQMIIVPVRMKMGVSWNNGWELAASILLTWVIGISAAKLFEIPFLKLRQRFVPA